MSDQHYGTMNTNTNEQIQHRIAETAGQYWTGVSKISL